MHGKTVLVHIDGRSWLVDNSELQACTAGVSYRRSKQFDDKVMDAVATWGSCVNGTDAGDGWLQIQVQSRLEAIQHGRLAMRSMTNLVASSEQLPLDASF